MKKNLIQPVSISIAAILFLIAITACSKKGEAGKTKPVETRLKVTTYNVHFFQAGYEPVKKTINDIKPDVIALQEVLLVQGRNYAANLSKDLSYHHISSTPYVSYDNIKWVLSFLSIYPIKKWSETRLGEYRRALQITIDCGGKEVNLVTMHLTPFTWSDKNLLQANRNMAMLRKREINDLLKWSGKPESAVILLGDFNSLPFMDELAPIVEAGYKNIIREIGNTVNGTFKLETWVKTAIKRNMPGFPVPDDIMLDYILVSDGVKPLSIETLESKSSDHLPLSAEVLITEKTDRRPD